VTKWGLVAVVAAVVVALDFVTKAYILQNFSLYETVPVIEGFFHITYVSNPGGAFGILRDVDASLRLPFFVVVACIAVGALMFFVRQLPTQERFLQFALGLVLGGAVGNLIDRVRFGAVVDFLDFFWGDLHWPAFNVADSGISVGVVILMYYSIFTSDERLAGTQAKKSNSE